MALVSIIVAMAKASYVRNHGYGCHYQILSDIPYLPIQFRFIGEGPIVGFHGRAGKINLQNRSCLPKFNLIYNIEFDLQYLIYRMNEELSDLRGGELTWKG